MNIASSCAFGALRSTGTFVEHFRRIALPRQAQDALQAANVDLRAGEARIRESRIPFSALLGYPVCCGSGCAMCRTTAHCSLEVSRHELSAGMRSEREGRLSLVTR